MDVGIIARRYAKALLEYAKEQKAEDIVFVEMNALLSAFKKESRLRAAMDNPILSAKIKSDLLTSIISGGCSVQYSRFIGLVIKHRRELCLQRIALSYIELYRKDKHIMTGRLVTACPIEQSVLEKLKSLLLKIRPGELDLETSVDPKIEGGFVLYVGTYRLDASVAAQLKNIKQQWNLQNSKIS